MTRTQLLRHLRAVGACADAIEWADDHPGSPSVLWGKCKRADWLLWIARVAGVGHKMLVLASCDCAEIALVHVPADEDRPRLAIEAARAWCRGEATSPRVRAAYAAVYAAADAAYAAYAADGADGAAMARLVRRRITWATVARGLSS